MEEGKRGREGAAAAWVTRGDKRRGEYIYNWQHMWQAGLTAWQPSPSRSSRQRIISAHGQWRAAITTTSDKRQQQQQRQQVR